MELDKLRIATRIASRLVDDLVASGRIGHHTGNLIFDKLTDSLLTEDTGTLQLIYSESVEGVPNNG